MTYREVARTILGFVLLLAELGHKQTHAGHYKKKRCYRPEEAPAKEREHARHATAEEHRTAEEHEWKNTRRMAYLTTLLAAVAVVLAYCSFDAAQRLSQDSHTTLLLSQSAFVYGIEPSILPAISGIDDALSIKAGLKNSGPTPAKNAVYKATCAVDPDYSTDFFPETLAKAVSRTALIGPSVILPIIPCTFSEQSLADIEANHRTLAVIGAIDYSDVVSPNTKHHSEFCYGFRFFGTIASGQASFLLCDHHNCADDECTNKTNIPYASPWLQPRTLLPGQ